MRVLLSAVAAVTASLALGPALSGYALAYAGDLVVPRHLPRSKPISRRTSSRPAAFTANASEALEAAGAKRRRKNARRLELAA